MEKANKSFEDQWSEAFEGAEMSPPEHVWASIDGALANQAAAGYKKRIIFFKWVAAASISLALISGIALLNQNWDRENSLAKNTESTIPQIADRTIAQSEIEISKAEQQIDQSNEASVPYEEDLKENQTEGKESVNLSKVQKSNNKETNSNHLLAKSEKGENGSTKGEETLIRSKSDKIKQTDNSSIPTENNSLAVLLDNTDESNSKDSQFLERRITEEEKSNALIKHRSTAVSFAPTGSHNEMEQNHQEFAYVKPKSVKPEIHSKPWEAEQLYLVPDLFAVINSKSNQAFDLWAGVSFSSGSFNPGTGESATGTPDMASAAIDNGLGNFVAANTVPLRSEYVTGNSFSAGMNLGGKLSKKILLSSGLHYSAVSPGSTSNMIVTDRQSNESFALSSGATENSVLDNGLRSGNLEVTQGVTNFSNTLQYLSIPLKAGYVILDRKFNLVLNSGMSTNILVGSSLYNSDGGLQNYNNTERASDTFSQTYFDFLTSIELGYRFREKYHLSLEPNYRRAINNFTKSGSSFEGRPTNFGVSLGIKYNF